MNDKVFRFVITHVGKHDLRTLTFASQGRNTYETRGEAERLLEAFRPGLVNVLGDRVDTLKVLEVECWPGHHDPKRTIFDDDAEGETEEKKPTILMGRPDTAHHDAAQAVFAADPKFCEAYTAAWFANVEGKESDIDNLAAELDRRVREILGEEHPIRQYI